MKIHTILKFGIGICIFKRVKLPNTVQNINPKCAVNRAIDKERLKKYSQANLE
jgi:hypothetical protein